MGTGIRRAEASQGRKGLRSLQATLVLAALNGPVFAQIGCEVDTVAINRVAEQVGDALADKPLFALGEMHGMVEQHCMFRYLVARLVAAGKIDAVVVEFGNGRYQPLVDRWLAGEEIADSLVRQAWRNTTQVFAWHEQMYPDFYRWMRELNREHRVRLILGDPPIDWSAVTAPEHLQAMADRDAFTAAVIEREVLQKKKRAVIIIGAGHLWRTDRGFAVNLAERLDSISPGALFVAQPSYVFSDSMPASAGGASPVRPSLMILDHASAQRKTVRGAEGIWDLGPLDELHGGLPDPAEVEDPAWHRELQRRAELASAAGWGPPTAPDMARWLKGKWPTAYRDRLR